MPAQHACNSIYMNRKCTRVHADAEMDRNRYQLTLFAGRTQASVHAPLDAFLDRSHVDSLASGSDYLARMRNEWQISRFKEVQSL